MLTQGKRKGYIKAETIKSRFDRYNLSDEEFDAVINKFADEDIEVIIEGEEPDDMYSDLDIDIQISASSEDSRSVVVDTLKTYINEVHQFPTLTKNEIKLLIRRISEGDATAREYLINCNLKFALSIAMKYAHNGLPILDLIQQANIGVIVATDRFNPNMGTTFSSYCVFWIKRYIINTSSSSLSSWGEENSARMCGALPPAASRSSFQSLNSGTRTSCFMPCIKSFSAILLFAA